MSVASSQSLRNVLSSWCRILDQSIVMRGAIGCVALARRRSKNQPCPSFSSTHSSTCPEGVSPASPVSDATLLEHSSEPGATGPRSGSVNPTACPSCVVHLGHPPQTRRGGVVGGGGGLEVGRGGGGRVPPLLAVGRHADEQRRSVLPPLDGGRHVSAVAAAASCGIRRRNAGVGGSTCHDQPRCDQARSRSHPHPGRKHASAEEISGSGRS